MLDTELNADFRGGILCLDKRRRHTGCFVGNILDVNLLDIENDILLPILLHRLYPR